MSSNKFNGSALVEGSLTAAIDDDSSDEEGDEQEPSPSDTAPYAGAELHLDMGDDEEELEVFSKGAVHAVKGSSGVQKSAPSAENSLIDAMMASVSKVELFGSGGEQQGSAQAPSQTPTVSDPVPAKSSAAVPADDSSKAETVDMFGIAYKPFMKKGDGYTMPKGAAFEDEAEFEQEMVLPQARGGQEDDEFDIDVDESSEKNQNNQSNEDSSSTAMAVEKRAMERAARAAREAEEEALFLAAVKDENRLQIEKARESATVTATEEVDSSIPKPSIRLASKQSLDEIVGIYSSGLGDQEVLMLDSDGDQGDKGGDREQRPTPIDGAKWVSTIDEGDEEEAEREEQEADLREETAIAEGAQQRMRLEAEWVSVGGDSDLTRPGDQRAVNSGGDDAFTAVTYAEALECLRGEDFSAYEGMINTKEDQPPSWSLSRPVALKFKDSEEKLRFPFLLAQHNYEASSQHLRNILRSIFNTLTALNGTNPSSSSSFPPSCPPVGPHWELIGFQGLDPRTDVNRSMKMLAILQALSMVETAPSMVRRLFVMANLVPSPSTGGLDLSWPFMCVSIMFTKEAVQAIRSGDLNKECNRREDVLSLMNEFHQACFYDFAKRVIADPVLHHAVHLSKVRDACKKSPLGLLKSLSSDAAGDYPLLSLDALFSKIPVKGKGGGSQGPGSSDSRVKKPEGKFRLFGGKAPPVGSAVPAPKGEEADPEIETEAGDLNFDDIERIEDEGTGEQKSISRSIWSSLTGGGKASKFKA